MHMKTELGRDLYLDLDASDIAEIIETRYAPRNRSASGYGSKIPTRRMIKGTDRKTRRRALIRADWSVAK